MKIKKFVSKYQLLILLAILIPIGIYVLLLFGSAILNYTVSHNWTITNYLLLAILIVLLIKD